MNRRHASGTLLLAICAGAYGVAVAQDKAALTLVVGYSAGGSADLVARVIAPELGKRLGRQVIVENIAGASGMLALHRVVNAKADGQALYMGGTDTVVIPMVNPKVKRNWATELTAVGRVSTVPMVFAVPKDSKFSNLPELIAAGRRGQMNQFNFATPGVGTMQHLYGALINKQAKIEMSHIPYRGGSQIVNDLVGQQVDSAVLVLSTAMPFLKEGKIKALSVSDSQRVPSLPSVKPIGEEDGFNSVALPLWQGIFVKAGTPAPLLASYDKALSEALTQPEVRQKLADYGITLAPMNGPALATFVKGQEKVYRDIIDAARISQD